MPRLKLSQLVHERRPLLELKLAIRLTAGDEVPLADCERIVRALDTDGNGALDFHEFKQALAECSRVSLGNDL